MRPRRGLPRSAPAAAPGAARGPVRPAPAGRHRGLPAGPPAAEAPADDPAGPPDREPRRRPGLRPRTVRARIIALLMVPVVSVMALWAFASVTTARSVWDLARLRTVAGTLLDPVDATVTGLQAERTAAGRLLAGDQQARDDLRTAAAATDRAAAPLALAAHYNRADAEGLDPEVAARVDRLLAAVAALPDLRGGIEQHRTAWADAFDRYTAAIDLALEVTGSVTPLQDHRVASDARVLLEFARSREQLAREDALLRAGRAAGSLDAARLRDLGSAVYARRLLARTADDDLRPADRTALEAVTGSADYRELTGYEDVLRGAPDGRAALAGVPGDRWAAVTDSVARGLLGVQRAAGTAAAERSQPYALGLFTPSGLAVLLGLAAVVASLLISVQIGRGLVTELVGLRNAALELAGRTLPATMRRLRAGEEIDVEAETPSVPYGGDEIGQVHGALATVRRAAVTAAVERAEVLSGVSGVFVNLARRSQVLVHRQLTLLDAMERRTEDPAELADLFRLDHLTTRMRRHAEGLIILSGAVPGRAWRRPVPLVDVVRAAVAEVEEYARVEVQLMPDAAVGGPAVADLTHLVAELVENATGFSPPHTRVRVHGERVGNGYALEIEDRGLGMGREALADANRRIAASEQVDLFDSDRLGLFVVSRLARRHGIRVALRTSAYGGTTAVVLLPTDLLAGGPEAAVKDAAPGVAKDAAPGAAPTAAPVPPSAAPRQEGTGAALPVRPVADAAEPGGRPSGAPSGARGGRPGGLRRTPFRPDGSRTAAPVPSPAVPRPAPPAPPPVVPAQAATAPPSVGEAPAEPAAVEGVPAVEVPVPPVDDGLPRRVRQASLAPQLREAPPKDTVRSRADGAPADRDPEQARAAFSAYQRGWARGTGESSDRPRPTGGETA